MLQKKFWIPILIIVLAMMGCGLFYTHLDQYPPGVIPDDDISHISTPSIEQAALRTPRVVVNPTNTSTNPLLKDVVKQRLQCPPVFVDVYVDEVLPEQELLLHAHLRRCVIELLKRYNPNRPLTEVYPMFVEAEKWYHANADPERAGSIPGRGANRIDWIFQSYLDFPEIILLMKVDPLRATAMYKVEMGYWKRDWNALELPDGRTFRADYQKFYKFTTDDVYKFEKHDGTMLGKHEVVLYFGISGNDAELLKINLDTTSDEELEHLSGWNYTINPYTTGAYKLGENTSGNP